MTDNSYSIKMERLLTELQKFKEDINGNWSQKEYKEFQEKFEDAYIEVTGYAGEYRAKIAKMQEITVDVVDMMASLDIHPQNLKIQEYTDMIDVMNKELEINDTRTEHINKEIQDINISIHNLKNSVGLAPVNDSMMANKTGVLNNMNKKKEELKQEQQTIQDRSYEILVKIEETVIPVEGQTKYKKELFNL